MRQSRSWLIRLSVAFMLAATVAIGAGHAQNLNDERASGAVGEQFDGYAVARDSGATALVESVNAKRREIYTQRAAEQGVAADQVGRVYAKEIMQKAPAGTWFRDESGNWSQK